MKYCTLFIALLSAVILASCSNREDLSKDHSTGVIKKGDSYSVVIVVDSTEQWANAVREGFRMTLANRIEEKGGSVEFIVYDTLRQKVRAQSILSLIRHNPPDLVCTVNFPTVFADIHISKWLEKEGIPVVSENCTPVRSGLIDSWDHPGGTITGVSLFIDLDPTIKLARQIAPSADKMVFYSWDQIGVLNDWFRDEAERVCKEEGIALLEFHEVRSLEDTLKMFTQYRNRDDIFFMSGVIAYINNRGAGIKSREEVSWIRKNMQSPVISNDEQRVKEGLIGGTCVVWSDIGAQLGEKGIRVLNGEDPGSIPWERPRIHENVFNQQRADDLGLTIPQELLDTAYRVYTDYKGNYK